MAEKSLKVLAIGNSFSQDAMEYLYDIANNFGYKDISLGNLYIGGCSLEEHMNQINNGLTDYIYFKNNNGKWNEQYNANILTGLLDEEWDYICLQQVSYLAGVSESYNEDLDNLISFVKEKALNVNVKLIWHMTWAYQSNSDHGGFNNYNYDQMKMYSRICNSVKTKILTRNDITMIIPSGTAIQNLRTSPTGDNLTRDGFHLSFDIGRYTAALCWFKQITGEPIELIDFLPKGVNYKDFEYIKESVNESIKHPYEVTDVLKVG